MKQPDDIMLPREFIQHVARRHCRLKPRLRDFDWHMRQIITDASERIARQIVAAAYRPCPFVHSHATRPMADWNLTQQTT